MNSEWILAVVPWLAVLACPAIMFWMMRGGSGRSCHGDAGAEGDAEKGQPRQGDRAEEIRALKARVEELEARARSEEWSR